MIWLPIARSIFLNHFERGLFIKTIGHDFANFVKHNPIYLVCSVLYYLIASLMLGGMWYSFLIAFVAYAVSLAVVFSPLGEKLLRMVEQVRKLEMRKEKENLLPMFQEVYEQAKQKNPELGNIELCVIEKMEVNACAIGKHTVALSRGAIETFGEDELKALIAHEIAHIAYGDTIATPLYRCWQWAVHGLYTAQQRMSIRSRTDNGYCQRFRICPAHGNTVPMDI